MRRSQSGFTLIELLVVIAIIAILSTIVLSSLGTARQRARDTRAKSEMSQLRAQAELYFTNGNTFDDVCTEDKSKQGLSEMIASIESNADNVDCQDDLYGFTAIAEIKGEEGDNKYFCVDSNGYAGFSKTNSLTPNIPVECDPV